MTSISKDWAIWRSFIGETREDPPIFSSRFRYDVISDSLDSIAASSPRRQVQDREAYMKLWLKVDMRKPNENTDINSHPGMSTHIFRYPADIMYGCNSHQIGD